jgi:putative lipoprotein
MYTGHHAMTRAAAPPAWMATLPWSLLFCLLFSSAARAEPDPWLGRDKALHFSASALIAGAGYGGAAVLTEDRRWRLAAGAGLAIGAGAGKEIADSWGYGDPSWRDFTWDLIGAATGLGVAWLIDHFAAAPRGPAAAAGRSE